MEEPSRIAKLIKTDGWQPVDTRIRVSAVADLVAKLGGKDLYGDTVTPPLREMIQNAADAVRARRLIDGRPADWGEIRVTSGKDDTGVWIQVEDTGVGMSEAVLTGPLLDFGTSFWSSALMHDQLPGLAAKGFQATGRYGIGFFSVFMWGERVEVATQRFDKGRADTFVLSFRKGLKERPLLRQALTNEHIPDGGTRVKVWFADIETFERLHSTFDEDKKFTLSQVCALIAPCLDVTLKADGDDGKMEIALTANDWLVISDEALLKRIAPDDGPKGRKASYYETESCPPLEVLRTADGRPVSRAAIWRGKGFYSSFGKGIVTVGGLRACALGGIIGVFVGSPRRAARDAAVPTIPIHLLTEWARRERDKRLNENHPPEVLAELAEVFCALGIEPEGVPVAQADSGWISLEQIRLLAKQKDEVLLVQNASIELAGGKASDVELKDGVLAVEVGKMSILQFENRYWFEWPTLEVDEDWGDHKFHAHSVIGAVIRTLAKGWGCRLEEVLKASSFGSEGEVFEREVGTLTGKPFIDDVTIIRRPVLLAHQAPDVPH